MKPYDERAQRITCPRCNAGPKQTCTSKTGSTLDLSHTTRYKAAMKKIEEETRVLKQRGLDALSLEN